MPFVPVPNTALVEIRMSAGLQLVENTLWFEFSADPLPADLAVLTAALFSWWTTSMAPLISSAVQLREITATSMTSATSPVNTFVPPVAEFGTNTANIMPGNVTMSVSFRTAQRGRSFRGRNYAVGITEDQVAGNNFVAGLTALWQAGYEDILAAIAASDWVWVVVSRFSGVDGAGNPIPRIAGVTTPIDAIVVVDDFVDSQRRRLTGRGA